MVNNSPDLSLANSIKMAKGTLGKQFVGPKLSNFINLFISKFGPAIIFAHALKSTLCDCLATGLTTFSVAIVHVILMCSKIKMIWINTLRVITGMANHHSMWDFTFANLPCHPMCYNSFMVRFGESTITISMKATTFPSPATVSFFNLRPKARSYFIHTHSPFLNHNIRMENMQDTYEE